MDSREGSRKFGAEVADLMNAYRALGFCITLMCVMSHHEDDETQANVFILSTQSELARPTSSHLM